MKVIVLGSGANGGIPQWDCCCPNCTNARIQTNPIRTRSSIMITLDGKKYILIDAGPDLKFQLEGQGIVPRIEETGDTYRHNKIDAILLTHGHGDHTVGLAEFSTGKSFGIPVFAPTDLIEFLFGTRNKTNYFGELGRLACDYVKPYPIVEGEKRVLIEKVEIEGFMVDHTEKLSDGSFYPSCTFGYEIKANRKRFLYIPDLGIISEDLLRRVEGADLLIIDATFWWNNELSKMSGLNKTSYDLGHIPVEDSIKILREIDISKVIYTHMNHTNPILNHNQPMRSIVNKEGFEVAYDGMVINL